MRAVVPPSRSSWDAFIACFDNHSTARSMTVGLQYLDNRESLGRATEIFYPMLDHSNCCLEKGWYAKDHMDLETQSRNGEVPP